MLTSDQLKLRQSALSRELAELAGIDAPDDSQLGEITAKTKEYRSIGTQVEAALIAEAGERKRLEAEKPEDSEGRELRELRGKAKVGNYIAGALEQRGASGVEAELNAALGMAATDVPMELMAPPEPEMRTTTEVSTSVMQSSRWLDRLFAATAATRVGVTMESVAAGTASYPVTTAGADPVQRAREEATTDASWSIGTTEIKPTRLAASLNFTLEDKARLPGLEMALRRDLAASMVEKMDRIMFLGDAGATGTTADIAGFQTIAAAATGLTEVTLTQANKVKPAETLATFVGMVDGLHAASEADLGIVASVGANTLWKSTIANATAENQTLAAFLMANGINWGVRAGIDTATANGDFGAFIGRRRGIAGAAIAAIWENAQLIVDPYSDSKKGMVHLTLTSLWNFRLIRASHFRRLKFVSNS